MENLINNIKNHLKNNDTLENAQNCLINYNSIDWKQYCNFENEGYLRNLVFKSSLFEIYIICWSKNSSSSIHDHAKRGCIMKVLDGELIENLYNSEIKKVDNKVITKDEVKYIDNQIGYHKITSKKQSISLHIYSPPNYISQKFNIND